MSTLRDISTPRVPGPSEPGRRCARKGCQTILSRYNETDYCWPHGNWGSTEQPEAPDSPPERYRLALLRLMDAA